MQIATCCIVFLFVIQNKQQATNKQGDLPPPKVSIEVQGAVEIRQALREYSAASQATIKHAQDDQTPGHDERALAEAMAFRYDWSKRTFQLAEKYRKHPDLIPLLAVVVQDNNYLMKPTAETRANLARAVGILHADFVVSARLERFCQILCEYGAARLPESAELLREAIMRNPHRAVQGMARLSLAVILQDRNDDDRRPEAERQANRQEADKLLEEIKAQYADLPEWKNRKNNLGTLAEERLFVLRHLSLGEPALEIVGKDLAGTAFRLSDYRGKIVVLNFWHTRCLPCIEMIPDERSLVKRMSGEPFALLGINRDENLAELDAFVKARNMTWRMWADGGEGAIAKQWHVQAYPTIYVIDAKGVIRFKGLRGKNLDVAVDELLAGMKLPKAASIR